MSRGCEEMDQPLMNATEEMTTALHYCLKRIVGDFPSSAKIKELAALLSGAKRDEKRARDLCHELPNCLAPSLALIGFDLPGIQLFVLDTNKRGIIRASSEMIHRACNNMGKSLKAALGPDAPESLVVFSGGGQGIVMVPVALLDQAKAAILHSFQEVSINRTPVIEALIVTPLEMIELKGLGDEWSAVRKALGYPQKEAVPFNVHRARLARRIESARKIVGHSPIGSLRCKYCGIRPPHEPAERPICQSCLDRQAFYHQELRQDDDHDDLEATDFSDIQRPSKGKGTRVRHEKHVAVIYADGNNIGAVLEQLKTVAHYRAFSRALDGVIQEGAMLHLEQLGIKDKVVRLLVGGDDLLLLMPGPLAMEFAMRLCATVDYVFHPQDAGPAPQHERKEQPIVFNQKIRALKDDLWRTTGTGKDLGNMLSHVGLSLGVVFAEPTFPLRLMVRYAKEVLGEAKRRAHQQRDKTHHPKDDGPRHLIDFICAGKGAHVGTKVGEERRIHLMRHGRQLTERPYSLEELKLVLQEVELLRRQHRTQIYALRDVLLHSPGVGKLHLQYQAARNKEWSKFCQELSALHQKYVSPYVGWPGDGAQGDRVNGVELASWRRRGKAAEKIATPIIDWMELLDRVDTSFISEEVKA
jgi:hypothetical protein